MSRKVIAIDIDDVLSSQVDVIIDFSKNKYGLHLTHDDFKTPGDYWGYYEKIWNVGDVEGAKRFNHFLEEKYPLKQVVSQETIGAIKELKKTYELEIVTSRGVDYQEGTLLWIEEHLPDVFRGVHFVELWNEGSKKATKAKVCHEIGAGYLIDDNPEHCNLAAEAGVHALLFGEFGWNLDKQLHSGVQRVRDWSAVLEYFNERS